MGAKPATNETQNGGFDAGKLAIIHRGLARVALVALGGGFKRRRNAAPVSPSQHLHPGSGPRNHTHLLRIVVQQVVMRLDLGERTCRAESVRILVERQLLLLLLLRLLSLVSCLYPSTPTTSRLLVHTLRSLVWCVLVSPNDPPRDGSRILAATALYLYSYAVPVAPIPPLVVAYIINVRPCRGPAA